jgi:hypothetical protein
MDTSTHFESWSSIWPEGLLLPYCHLQYFFSTKFCRGPFLTFATCSYGHLRSLFSLLVPPTPFFRRDFYITTPLITGRDCQGSCADNTPALRQQICGISHAFSLAFRGPKKSTCFCCPVPAMPQTHLGPELMQVASQMHWDARTWKVGLCLRRHWTWRHILTVQRGRTVWANPTLSQSLSSLFLFPDLNQCLFFSSQQHGIWFPAAVPIRCPPPSVSALHLLGTSDITILSPALKELFSTLLGSLRL